MTSWLSIRPRGQNLTEFLVGEDARVVNFFFQVPQDFDIVSMGEKFETMGIEMQKGGRSGTNWHITEDINEFHHLLYGESTFRKQGANKQAKIRTKNDKKAETEDDEVQSV